MTDSAGATPVVGFVGLGNMGRPMVRRLVRAGYPVTAFDAVDATLASMAAETDVIPARSAADTAAGSDVVILMLPNSDAVEEVLLGQGLLHAAPAGTLVIDMSSSEPSRTQRLAASTAERGVTLIDAPVSGGVTGAEQGTLTIMVGGEPDVLARAEPILGQLGSRVRHAGPVGAGHAVKALNNLMSATHLLSACEAMVTGQRFGLDPDLMLEIVNGSSGRSGSTENKLPNFVRTGRFDTGFAMGLMLKDMRIALGLAHVMGTPCALSEAAVELWTAAVKFQGPGSDHTEIARWVRRLNTSGEDD